MVSHHGAGGPSGLVRRYRRLVEPAVRGRAGIAITVAAFLVASALGGRAGVAVAATWVLASGTYCLANFWFCREAHCVVTGTGWSALALMALASVVAPGGALGWLRVDVLVAVFLGVLATGYGFEAVVAARTGRHVLGVGNDGAEAR